MQIERFEKKKVLSPEDLIYATFDINSLSKEVIYFCVVQVYSDFGKDRQIIKFDTSHGQCHAHYYYKAEYFGSLLFNKAVSWETLNDCIKDISENWQKYKLSYIAKRQ